MLGFQDLSPTEKIALLAKGIKGLHHAKYLDGDLLTEYPNDPLGFITEGLGQLRGDSWNSWRIILKAAYGQPLFGTELEFFRMVCQRDPPGRRVKELWFIVGRRAGKDSVASTIAIECARHVDQTLLRPGERPIVACLAANSDQASIVFDYIKGYFEENPRLRRTVVGGNIPNTYRSGAIQLRNKVDIRVTTNNFRAPRGRAIAAAIFDEVAFWRDEKSATPDVETYRAIRPGMSTVPNSILIGITTPHKMSGLAYAKYEEHFGKETPDILVVQAETRLFNPLIDIREPGVIEKDLEDDPEYARAEWFAIFREDLADFVTRATVMENVVKDREMLPPERGIYYHAFCDPSGGVSDSMTLAIAHEKDKKSIVDCVLEARAPFKPKDVCKEFADKLKEYHLASVVGDRYAGNWPVEEFASNNIKYEHSELTKSEIYLDFLPHLNSRRTELVDNKRMIAQLCSLERRSVRGGRDKIDHPPARRHSGEQPHDDVINAVAGACGLSVKDVTDWERLARATAARKALAQEAATLRAAEDSARRAA